MILKLPMLPLMFMKAISLPLELLSRYFPRLSFLTSVNILIKNYPMKNLRFRQAVYAGDMKSPKLPSQNHYLEVYVN